jgi:predicted DNA-binding protein
MKKRLIIRIDEELKSKFSKIARIEGKTASEKIRELVSAYTVENDFAAAVDSLWDRISEKIENGGFKQEDIDKKIKEARSRKK